MENIILKGANRTHNKCRVCGKIKPIEDFCSDKRSAYGHNTLCKECKREEDREYHQRVKQDPERHLKELAKKRKWKQNHKDIVQKSWTEYNNRPEIKERKQKWAEEHSRKATMTIEQYKKDMLRHAKNRAEEKGFPFNITIEDIVIPEFCPILETPLIWQSNKWTAPENVPSLDKIIPEKGYVKGNVQIISFKANTMKLNASREELLLFAKNIGNYLNSYKEDIVQTIENKESIESENKESQS